MTLNTWRTTLFFLILFVSPVAYPDSADKIPVCEDKHGKPLPINSSEVIHWKHSTPNQFESRAHIKGKISKLYQTKNGHRHFEVTFSDSSDEDTIEIIYNEGFGEMPSELELDMNAEACGDYITATAASGPYPPSPDGAIIHWVHENPSGKGHPDGYVVLNGLLYGFGRKENH